ncbi:hypothetical protein BDW72DRAFT_184023 [Aspergillus terricola var. indicus]
MIKPAEPRGLLGLSGPSKGEILGFGSHRLLLVFDYCYCCCWCSDNFCLRCD